MGKFGWDLPPGCSIRDIERNAGGGDPSPESEKAYEILEAAEVDQDVIDKVCELIDTLAEKAYRDISCPVCDKAAMEAELAAEKAAEEYWKTDTAAGEESL